MDFSIFGCRMLEEVEGTVKLYVYLITEIEEL